MARTALPSADLQDVIQRQLTDLLHGQERLEKMMAHFANSSMWDTPIKCTVGTNGTNGNTPRNGIRANRKPGSRKVQLCQVASARGDAMNPVTPRFPPSEGLSTPIGEKRTEQYPLQNDRQDGIFEFPLVASIDEDTCVTGMSVDTDVKNLLRLQSMHAENELIDENKLTKQVESNFQESRSAVERSKNRLRDILKDNHEIKMKEAEKERRHRAKRRSVLRKVVEADSHRKEIWFDAVIQVVIVFNTLFIGISLDYKHANDWNIWLVSDMAFLIVFILELLVKLFLHGFVEHFTGPDKITNIFDFIIVSCDSVQFIMSLHDIGKDDSRVRSASVLRVARLLRVVRIIRQLRFEGMRAFVDMMQGILDGAATLFWAILMFMLMVYCGGILCKICFGTASTDEEMMKTVYPYFSTVSRSMLTVFRCAFGDCSTAGGTPIPEFILEENGKEYALGYCLFLFFITIGLFNIISAIFVDSTMKASSDVQLTMKNERLNSNKVWATSVSIILAELLASRSKEIHDDSSVELTPENMEANFDQLVKLEFSRTLIEEVVQDNRKVQEALDCLDIDTNDHKRLSDILDPDHSGTIDVLELMEGLRCLRGEPRRSDVVTCDLMIRALQSKTDDVLAEVLDVKSRIEITERAALTMAERTALVDVKAPNTQWS